MVQPKIIVQETAGGVEPRPYGNHKIPRFYSFVTMGMIMGLRLVCL